MELSLNEIKIKIESGLAVGFGPVLFYQDVDYEDTYFNMVFDDEDVEDETFETLDEMLEQIEFFLDDEITLYHLDDNYWQPI